MFKRLRAKLLFRSGAKERAAGSLGFADESADLASEDFIEKTVAFENRCQPFLELAEKAQAHCETVAETGKINQKLMSRLDEAMHEIRSVEMEIQKTLESASELSHAAQARFETAADKIADVHAAVEGAIKHIRMARADFESLRDEDEDDDDDEDNN
ncbi:MAG: hypothetical protein AAF724_21105 [Pseudomonadota bacterium]